jgi:hypothetical protein
MEKDDKSTAHEALEHAPKAGERYRHYKGGEYEVVCSSIKEDTLEALVTYRSLARGTVWTRTLANWSEMVEGVPRFARL